MWTNHEGVHRVITKHYDRGYWCWKKINLLIISVNRSVRRRHSCHSDHSQATRLVDPTSKSLCMSPVSFPAITIGNYNRCLPGWVGSLPPGPLGQWQMASFTLQPAHQSARIKTSISCSTSLPSQNSANPSARAHEQHHNDALHKQGDTRSCLLSQEAQLIWQWCI